MFFQCVDNKLSFIRQGGLSVFLETLRMYMDDVRVTERGSITLRTFSCGGNPYRTLPGEDHRITLSNEGVLQVLLDISRKYPSNPLLQENVLWSLLNLTINSRMMKGLINQAEGIPVVYHILINHDKNPNLVFLCITLFNQISTRTTTRVAVARGCTIQLFLDLLYYYQHNLQIQIMCLKLLDILCTLSLSRKRLAQDNRLNNLIAWLMEDGQMANTELVVGGINLCQKLAMSAAVSKQALQDCGGEEFFEQILSYHQDNKDLVYATRTAHRYLLEPADYDSESSEEEVLSSGGSDSDDIPYDVMD
eukprot:TRINITY_DN7210_c0_g2_i1.p1 TRINITY_DN7210_c0_g2~~TRINITY_DN7210_c0_g2_i1.p1  ORF type:complete len:306 (+),score=60.39 TRINITY_DN7210_c0_g2_i1:148-1065(+)